MAAAEAEATKNNLPMAIIILDSTGHTVMLHKLDNTQYGSIRVAEDKAHTALDFRRSSKVFEDLVAQSGIGMRALGLHGATPIEGGFPIIVDGKIVGRHRGFRRDSSPGWAGRQGRCRLSHGKAVSWRRWDRGPVNAKGVIHFEV